MSVAFWSVVLKNGKPVEVQPPEGYVLNVQQIALLGDSASAVVRVSTTLIEGEKVNTVLATLRSGKTDQTSLNLVFGYDVPLSFSVTCKEEKAEVHVSGYFQPGPEEDGAGDDDESMDYDDFDGEEDDEDDEDDEDNFKNAELALAKLNAARKNKGGDSESEDDSEDEEDDSEDDDEDSEDEALDNAFVAKMMKKTQNGKVVIPPKNSRVEELNKESDSEDEDDSEDEEDDSEDGSEDEDSESEEEPPLKSQKTAPKGVVTPAGQKHQQNQPKTPQTQGKPQQHGQTPNKPQTPGNNNNNQNNKPKTPQQNQNNKPQTPGNNNNNQNNKPKTPQQHQNNHNNNKFQSGDKRKR